jgi:serine/threonine-protein phosphatase 2A activator
VALLDVQVRQYFSLLALSLQYGRRLTPSQNVNSGVIKIYPAEVFNKRPVVQRFPFSSILRYDGSAQQKTKTTHTEAIDMYMVVCEGFVSERWGDCCGIPVPS